MRLAKIKRADTLRALGLWGDRPSDTLLSRGQNEPTLPKGLTGPCESAVPLLGINPLGPPAQKQDETFICCSAVGNSERLGTIQRSSLRGLVE